MTFRPSVYFALVVLDELEDVTAFDLHCFNTYFSVTYIDGMRVKTFPKPYKMVLH